MYIFHEVSLNSECKPPESFSLTPIYFWILAVLNISPPLGISSLAPKSFKTGDSDTRTILDRY